MIEINEAMKIKEAYAPLFRCCQDASEYPGQLVHSYSPVPVFCNGSAYAWSGRIFMRMEMPDVGFPSLEYAEGVPEYMTNVLNFDFERDCMCKLVNVKPAGNLVKLPSGAYIFSDDYDVIAALPGVRISGNCDGREIWFRFDGGQGVIAVVE